MPLVGGRELLAAAERGRYAVPGFNVSNIELALGVLDAVEAHGSPCFLQFNPSNLDHLGGIDVAAALGRTLAARATVPVAVHLDHGTEAGMLRAALRAGFTSLMYDGSTLPLERNLRETREAYLVAAEAGVALEAELGHVAGREPGVLISEATLTDPTAARRFVDETAVDSLAVSVGTAHGLAGQVHLELLRELREATRGLPLVLHGGSGVRPRDLRLAVEGGIRKVNISSEIHAAFAAAVREALGGTSSEGAGVDPRRALRRGREAVALAAGDRIAALGAARQA